MSLIQIDEDGNCIGYFDYNEAYDNGEITASERDECELDELLTNYHSDCCYERIM